MTPNHQRVARGVVELPHPDLRVLAKMHADELRASAVDPVAAADQAGVFSCSDAALLGRMTGDKYRAEHLPALVYTYVNADGLIIGYRVKPAVPMPSMSGKAKKYTQCSGVRLAFLPPMTARRADIRADATTTMIVGEGEKTTLSIEQNTGLPCIGIGGAWLAHRKEQSPTDARQLHPTFDAFELRERDVVVCFDSDVPAKCFGALWTLADMLSRAGAKVRIANLPSASDGAKMGADDYIAAHGAKAFGEIISAALPAKEALDLLRAAAKHEPDELDATPDEAWSDPRPLTRTDALPECPTTALPDVLAAFVTALSIELQVAEPMALGFVLGSVSAVCGSRVDVLPPGWRDPELLCLFVGAVCNPGTLKSATLSACSAPVRALEKNMQIAKADLVSRSEARRELAKDRADTARDAAKRARTDEDREIAQHDYEDAKSALDAMPVVHKPRIIVGDTTVEKLLTIMHEQGGSIANISDEDSLVGHILGRYAKPGSAPANIESLLSAYSGKPITVDRLTRASLHIERPALTWCVPLQPSLFKQVSGAGELAGRGFFDRWVFLMTPDLTGSRDWDAPRMPVHINATYNDRLCALGAELYQRQDERGRATTLAVSAGAAAEYKRWRRGWERALGASGRHRPIVGWGSKALGLAWRLAGLLHVVGERLDQEIQADTMLRAFALIEYFAEHQHAAVDELGLDGDMRVAREIAAWIADAQEPRFTKRDLKRALPKASKPHLLASLKILADRGYVRAEPAPGGRGRPSEVYDVNPLVLTFGISGKPSRSLSEERERGGLQNTPLETLPETPKTPDRREPGDYREEFGAP